MDICRQRTKGAVQIAHIFRAFSCGSFNIAKSHGINSVTAFSYGQSVKQSAVIVEVAHHVVYNAVDYYNKVREVGIDVLKGFSRNGLDVHTSADNCLFGVAARSVHTAALHELFNAEVKVICTGGVPLNADKSYTAESRTASDNGLKRYVRGVLNTQSGNVGITGKGKILKLFLISDSEVCNGGRKLHSLELTTNGERKCRNAATCGVNCFKAGTLREVNRLFQVDTVADIQLREQVVITYVKLCQVRILIGGSTVTELELLQLSSHREVCITYLQRAKISDFGKSVRRVDINFGIVHCV